MNPFSNVDVAGLNHGVTIRPEMVPGRHLQIDGDFLAYQVSYSKEDDIQEAREYCDEIIADLKSKAGAEFCTVHLTPKGSDKGGRKDQALLKPYQEQRKNKDVPALLHPIREWLHESRKAILHYQCEADDGMAMAQYADMDNSVIASKDKDLLMVPGKHIDWDTGEITDSGSDPFGLIWIKQLKSSKKVVGIGWKFFFAQMLMGDTVDNIGGLPVAVSDEGKASKCGPVKAFKLLEDTDNVKDAYRLTLDLYKKAHEFNPELFRSEITKEIVRAEDAYISHAQLLWMRRSLNHNDVFLWIHEEINRCKIS